MDFVSAFIEWFNSFQEAIVAASDSPWVLVAVVALAWADGFFPAVPSESVVIAVAAVAVAGAGAPVAGLILAAALGAWLGDQTAFWIGRHIPVRTMRWFNSGRGARMLDWAEQAFQRRATSLIIAARFIPFGRVAVNVSAGAMEFPRFRFMQLTAFAGLLWGGYSTLLGLAAGVHLRDQPILAAAIGIALGMAVGLLVDRLLSWAEMRLTKRKRQTETTDGIDAAEETASPVETAESAEDSD